MKILKRGTKPKRFPWVGEAACAHCRSIFELTEDDEADVINWHHYQRDGISVEINCPVCDERRWISQQSTILQDWNKGAGRRAEDYYNK